MPFEFVRKYKTFLQKRIKQQQEKIKKFQNILKIYRKKRFQIKVYKKIKIPYRTFRTVFIGIKKQTMQNAVNWAHLLFRKVLRQQQKRNN